MDGKNANFVLTILIFIKMGKVLSVIQRKVNRFNVENRAHRVISKDKPTPAPKYPSTIKELETIKSGGFVMNCILLLWMRQIAFQALNERSAVNHNLTFVCRRLSTYSGRTIQKGLEPG